MILPVICSLSGQKPLFLEKRQSQKQPQRKYLLLIETLLIAFMYLSSASGVCFG